MDRRAPVNRREALHRLGVEGVRVLEIACCTLHRTLHVASHFLCCIARCIAFCMLHRTLQVDEMLFRLIARVPDRPMRRWVPCPIARTSAHTGWAIRASR